MRSFINKDSLVFSIGLILSTALSIPAFGQIAGEEGDAGDIVVTARRTEERLQDVPISITVFNQQQIDNRNIITASDLAIYTPSLSANTRFGGDKSSFSIRGFNQDGKTAPTVAVYFADVVALRANSGTGGSNGAGPGSMFDLQSLQVLKGPQGTLFGRNTTGGAILLVPQKPTDRLEGYVEGSLGSYDLTRVQAVLNLPLADTFKVRLGVDRQKRDGYLHNRSGIGPKDFADSNYIGLRGSIVAELTPSLENYFIATFSRSDTNGAMFKVIACNPTVAAGTTVSTLVARARMSCDQIARETAKGNGFYDVENFHPDPYNVTSQWQVINTTTWTASDNITVKNIASYGEYRERFQGSIGGEHWLPTAALLGPTALASLHGRLISNNVSSSAPGQYNNIQSAFTDELQIQGRAFDGRLNWQTGAYLELSKPMKAGDTTYSQTSLACTDLYALQCTGQAGFSSLGLVYNLISNRNIGFYAQGTYQLTDQLAVTAGARYTIDRMTGRGGRLNFTFTGNTITGAACSRTAIVVPSTTRDPLRCDSGLYVNENKRPTWVVDVEYKPIEDIMLYAKYSRGYRQGGVDPSVVGIESWGPETVDTYEVGAKTSFSGGAISGYLNVAAFYNDFTDQQVTQSVAAKVGSGARGILNAGKSKIWGVEADAAVTLFDSLKLEGGYTYLNTELSEFVQITFPDTSPYIPPAPVSLGVDLPLSPNHRVTLTGTYTLPFDESIGRIALSGTYVYTSSQSASIDPGPFGRLPSTNLVNLNLNWYSVMDSPVDLAFFVTNVTKEKFLVAVPDSYNSSGYDAGVPNQPRMWGLRAKVRFGN